ncbi:hypothetical protein [Blastococcus sp. SYSU D00813]
MHMPPIALDGEQVAPRHLLTAAGLSNYRLRTAVAAGRWQEPLPGVFVSHSGPLTRRERWRAALHYAGPGAVLSHRSALAARGCRVQELSSTTRAAGVRGEYVLPQEGGLVEVTARHGHHVRSQGFVVVHQSRRPVDAVVDVGGLRVAAPARAVVDAAVTARRRNDVDHVVAEVLQRALCTVPALEAEAARLGRRLTPWLRSALADARRGMRSVGEADLRRVVEAAGLPEPEWGAAVVTRSGTYFVDALWRDHGVAVEADGAAFHLSAEDWGRDLVRQNALMGEGLVLLRYPVRRLREAPDDCGAEITLLLT